MLIEIGCFWVRRDYENGDDYVVSVNSFIRSKEIETSFHADDARSVGYMRLPPVFRGIVRLCDRRKQRDHQKTRQFQSDT